MALDIRLAADHQVAAQTAPPDHLEAPLPTVPDRKARQPTGRGQGGVVPRPADADRALPLASKQHPHTMGQHVQCRSRIASGNPWSAGGAETCSSGAAGGPGKRTSRNAGTAPRSDPTDRSVATPAGRSEAAVRIH